VTYREARKEKGLFTERKAQKALDAANEYHEDYRSQIAMFDNANKYLRDVLQGRFDPKKLPITMWQQELGGKRSEVKVLTAEYDKLKDETAKIEKIKKGVAEIIESETGTPERVPTRARAYDMEL
jgi:hypothetical protein